MGDHTPQDYARPPGLSGAIAARRVSANTL